MPESGHHLSSPDNTASPRLTFAIGDIHGSLAKLRRLVARCHEHAGGRVPQFVFLGDYIDRGPQSAGVVRYLVEMQSQQRDRVVALKGNHEAMAIEVIDGATPEDFWLVQGGAETLMSYRVAAPRDLPRLDIEWMRALPLWHDDGRRFFVHAGVNPQKPLTRQDPTDLIWIREPFLSDPRGYGRLIVHGHTPLEAGAPDLRRNRLNIDTGAVFGGPLTAAVFTDARTEPIGFLQAE